MSASGDKVRYIDLNLLSIFDLLIRYRSVSETAKAIGISQPAVSNALKRLRDEVGDPLFVRGVHGMEPTSRALQLAEPIAYALDEINQSLHEQEEFAPQSDIREFKLLITEEQDYFIPQFSNLLEGDTGYVRITISDCSSHEVRDSLARGDADLAIGQHPELETNFHKRRLFRDRYVLLMREGHQLAEKSALSKADVNKASHILISTDMRLDDRVQSVLELGGLTPEIRLIVPGSLAAASALHNSDMIMCTPEKEAKILCGAFNLVKKNLPVSLPPLTVEMYWHERTHRDAGVRWLRSTIIDSFLEE